MVELKAKSCLGHLVMSGLAIILVAGSPTSAQSHQRSTDRNNPAPIKNSLLSDSIQEKDATSYFYAVTAEPGALDLTLQVSTQGAQTYLSVTVLDSNFRPLLKLDTTSSSIGDKHQQLSVSQKQVLIFEIKGARYNSFGNFKLYLKGRLSFLNSDPQSGRPTEPSPVHPQTIAKDTTPPRIKITSPQISRGQGANFGDSITITGEATDESGVSEVSAQGQTAQFDASTGKFSARVSLKTGENRIVVTARDIYDNRATETLTINRDLMLAGGTSTSPALPAASDGQYHALIIAVEKYQHPSITPLSYPVADGQNVRRIIVEHYTFEAANVTLLENPDRKAIISILNKLAKKLRPQDRLLIFYAGHGYWNEKRQQGYWLPSNSVEEDYSDWISNSDLREAINEIKAMHILVITDACFSGSLFVSREAFAKSGTIEEMEKLQSRTAMTSGALTTVPDRSVFVKYLLEYLEKNKDPYLLASDLFSRIRTPIINNSPRQSDGNRPTPRYGTIQEADDRGGDFIFERRRKR